MYKKILSVILAGLMLVSFAGCSNKEADKSESNELVLFNAKGENAAEFEEMCKAFTEETGIPTKPFSIGSGQDSVVLCQEKVQIKYNQFSLFM